MVTSSPRASCTVASSVWLAFCSASCLTACRVYLNIMNNATVSSVAIANTTSRLMRMDKVVVINLVGLGIWVQIYKKNAKLP